MALASGVIFLVCDNVFSIAWFQEKNERARKTGITRERRKREYEKQNSFEARIARHRHRKNLKAENNRTLVSYSE